MYCCVLYVAELFNILYGKQAQTNKTFTKSLCNSLTNYNVALLYASSAPIFMYYLDDTWVTVCMRRATKI